jgi:large subunit ribosomal protein L15
MFQLNNLEKTTEPRKRVGRGGKRGRYAGRGKEGQKSRTGSTSELKASFEGGQMPLVRRIPRRGFTNIFKKVYALVNLIDIEERFESGDVVNEATLREKGLIKGRASMLVKLLGNGTLTKKLTVHVNGMSKSAAQAIQNAGGTFQLN